MSFDSARFGDLFLEPQRNGLTRPKKMRGTGFPMVNMGELFAHPRIHDISMDLVPVDEKEHHYLLKAGDLLFARQSLVLSGAGQCSIFLGNSSPTVFESHLIRCRLDARRSNSLFYFYFFKSPEGRRVIEAIVEQGAGASGIRGSDLVNVEVPNPPKQVQDEIANILGLIDDRITLLRETNATLEAIAQALFKSWFVDFDPVRANAEGRARQYGDRSGQQRVPQGSDVPRPGAEAGAEAQGQPEYMDAATAALFPDSFEESELGLVPKGWSIGQLQDLLVLQRGFDLPAAERIEGEYPLIAASGPSGTHHTAMAKGPGVITGRSGVLGKVFLTLEDYWPLNTTLWVKEFKRAKPCFAFQLLKLLDFASFNAGSAVPTLNRNHVHSLKYVLPPVELVGVYEDTALVIYERVLENNRQAQTLTQLRDTLLPRLISGQLRLPETARSETPYVD